MALEKRVFTTPYTGEFASPNMPAWNDDVFGNSNMIVVFAISIAQNYANKQTFLSK
jgi:hypothetical protein